MKSIHRLLIAIAAPGLFAATALHAADPVPERTLTLDPTGHPRTDLNLSSTHVTGTLDAARLPAGVGSAFLSGVTKPTGTDVTALDHASLAGINVGDVRQVVFTNGLHDLLVPSIDAFNYNDGNDPQDNQPPTYVAATYRLADSSDVTLLPFTIATQTSGKVWRLVTATTSAGTMFQMGGVAFYSAGSIQLNAGTVVRGTLDDARLSGNVPLLDGSQVLNLPNVLNVPQVTTGYIASNYGDPFIALYDSRNGVLGMDGDPYIQWGYDYQVTIPKDVSANTLSLSNPDGNAYALVVSGPASIGGGSINLAGSVDTSNDGGIINTSNNGGSILTGTYGGYIRTDGYDVNGDGSLINFGGGIYTNGGASGAGGVITTSNGGGAIITNGVGSPEGVVSAPVGSLYTDQSGAAGAVLYVKEPGADSSHGWAAK